MTDLLITERTSDLDELQRLAQQATRAKVKTFLSQEITKVQAEVDRLKEQQKKEEAKRENIQATPSLKTSRINVSITTYAWDQSDKFMKIYVTLGGIHNAAKEQVTSHFTESSLKLSVTDVGGKDHELIISKLYGKIIPAESFHKVKSDTILLMLRKAESKTWTNVTPKETKPVKKPGFDDKKDPQEGLMDMLKQMYQDGDEETKRLIAKSWTESQSKRTDRANLDDE